MAATSYREKADQPSMKAWRVHEFGPAEKMVFETIARPRPVAGQVLVKVHAAGVGPWDAWIRAGKSALPQPLPLTLGSDLAGEVTALGPDVSSLAVNDQVFGVTNTQFLGAYAEYAVASTAMLSRKPRLLSYVEAAAVPVVAVTAWQGLFDHARLEAGQTVLIHGAAGSVGAFAVQLACRAKVRSVVTVGTRDIEYVRALGADKVVDYQTQRFEDEVRNADVVFDLIGGETQARSIRVLRQGGKLISIVSQPDQALAERHGVTATFFLVDVTTAYLDKISALIDRGDLKTGISAIMPLADAREAHMMLDGRRPKPHGKIVLSV
ncbi:NADP-dependent oxidoreductase [Bradyrhizobium symbiodeficiens]|uniref:NADP-dependent oxidoreductase n=1 Tax=Bradyrhizobium symbiodeficiens TaxID=1404367 RepID=UPI001FCF2485|nr:NADP-dependent oxidoreductase [Bradyrhizobium symbiodeficiens]